MRRTILLAPFFALAFIVTIAMPSHAQVSPGMSGGNALAPVGESAPTPTRVTRFQRGERVTDRRLPSLGTRTQAPARLRFALADYRILIRFIR
jgi:hypothetical protein